MRTIWKFPMRVGGRNVFTMPVGARIVHAEAVAGRNDSIECWVELSPSPPREMQTREWEIVGTGHPIADGLEYVMTARTGDGAFVWHIYEITELPSGEAA